MNKNILFLAIGVLLIAAIIVIGKILCWWGCKECKGVTFTIPDEVNVGEPMSFSDQTEGATTWNWNFGDGETQNLQTGTKVYTKPDVYEVELTVNGECKGIKSVRVNGKPGAVFSVTPVDLNPGDFITYADSTPNATIWSWDFGDGERSTTRSGKKKYTKEGDYTVALAVNGNITGTRLVSVWKDSTDQPPPPPPIIKISPTSAKVGDEITATDMTPGAAGSQWKFGETGRVDATGATATYKYNSPGTYTVVLTNSTRPGQQGRQKITINPPIPVPNGCKAPADDIIKTTLRSISIPKCPTSIFDKVVNSMKKWTNDNMAITVVYNGKTKDLSSYLNHLTIANPDIILVKAERSNTCITSLIVTEKY
jgi:PKD repeat protein